MARAARLMDEVMGVAHPDRAITTAYSMASISPLVQRAHQPRSRRLRPWGSARLRRRRGATANGDRGLDDRWIRADAGVPGCAGGSLF